MFVVVRVSSLIKLVCSPVIFFDYLLNNRKKDELFQEYLSRGTSVNGLIVQVKTFTSSFRRVVRYDVSYAYVAPGTDYLCVKPHVKFKPHQFDPTMMSTLSLSSRTIPIMVLPDHPNSGYPKSLIMLQNPWDRESYRGLFDFILSSFAILAVSTMILAMYFDGGSSYSSSSSSSSYNRSHYQSYNSDCLFCVPYSSIILGYAIIVSLILGIGYFISLGWYKEWENRILEGRTTQSRRITTRRGSRAEYTSVPTTAMGTGETESFIPAAEVVSILEGNDNLGDDGAEAAASDVELTQAADGVAQPVSAAQVPIATPINNVIMLGTGNTLIGKNNGNVNNNEPKVATVASVCSSDEQGNDTGDIFSIYDPTENDERTQQLRRAISDNDWKFVNHFLNEIRAQINERDFYIEIIVEAVIEKWKEQKQEKEALKVEDQLSPMLDNWVAVEPTNADCRLLRGVAFIHWAWDARTANLASAVPKDAWPIFEHRIELASVELQKATELDSTDALVCGYQSTILRAASTKTKSAAQRDREMEEVCVRLAASPNDPRNLSAHQMILQYYCQKWHGSHQKMFNYARNCLQGLPEGHPLWSIIITAHREMRQYLASMAIGDGSRDIRRGDPRYMIAYLNYYKQPQVRQEILHSYHQYVGSHALKSPITAAERNTLLKARNEYAQCLVETGDHDLARREIRTIGTTPTQMPWGYQNETSIEKYKKECHKLGVAF